MESFVAIAAESDYTGTGHDIDYYGHSIAAGVKFMRGQFLEKKKSSSQLFKLSNKVTFFAKKVFYTLLSIFRN